MTQTVNDYSRWKQKAIFFFASQTVTMFGSSLVDFAIIWYIARTTKSGTMIALSTLCAFAPRVIISLFAGVWADRYNRKRQIILADSCIAVSTFILVLLIVAGFESFPLLLMVSAVRSFGSGIQSPAVNALIPQIVPPDKLMRVNGINGSIQSLVNLVSPAVGGAMLTWGPLQNIMLVDVVTAIVGVTILSFIHVPLHHKATLKEKADYLGDLRAGVRYAVDHSFVRKLLLFFGVFSFLMVPPVLLNVLFVTRIYGDSYWYLTLNEMAFFVGAMGGGVAIAAWGGFKNRMFTLVMGCFGFGALTFAVGCISVFWIYLGVMVITGATLPMFNSPVMVMLQEKVDPDMQGRVFSLLQIVSSTIMPIGMMIYGPLADIVPIQALMLVAGTLMMLSSIVMLRNKSLMDEGLRSGPGAGA